MNHPRALRAVMLATSALCAWAGQAAAQQASSQASTVEEIVVVGSRIEGAKATAALPVTVVDSKQLDAVAASSGDDLFRAIPQMGDVNYNSAYLPGSSNSARGDIGSVNLRNLGSGNTLVLLNGRRVVAHPTSQADGTSLVPTITYNTNAIPTTGLKRLEVLRDGAAAIYGTDAVAGVVNTVLKDNFDGVDMEAQYGAAHGTHLKEYEFNGLFGHNFARGNVTVFLAYDQRTALQSLDQPYTRSADKRVLFTATRFDGATALDNRGTITPWGSFTASSAVRIGTTLITSTGGAFHIQPSTYPGSLVSVGPGISIQNGAPATSAEDRDLRYDAAASGITTMPALKRLNVFTTGNYEITDHITAFGEVGVYHAKTRAFQAPTTTSSAQVLTVPTSNYWNPFGPVTFASGAANPNRLAGTTAPATGLNVTLTSYNFVDAGKQQVDVTNAQTRFLAGLRGELLGWKWESALLYSEAKVKDVSDGISATAVQKQLALSTSDAYNPFNGGNLANTSVGDGAPSSQAALDAIRFKAKRESTSSLASWDFRLSKADLFHLPAGDVGVASGVEWRRETQHDDRDAHVDGTITYTNAVTGLTYLSDMVGTSPSPDTKGSRKVTSAYLEFAVPVISPEMGIPLVRNVELQLAGRAEKYSDVGSVAKPKVALAWDLIDGFRVRGSWAQGFKAPNLEQINATVVTRANTRTDWVRCEADLRAGRIASFSNCSRSLSVQAQRSGNPDLKPEDSETMGFGFVFQPKFIPSAFGDFTLTTDYWRVKQKGIVGLFGEGNALILDYLLRQGGSSNPNVVRAAPTSDDVAAFNGTGLAPVGTVLYVKDQYVNTLPQEARGVDIGLMWRKHGTPFGDFDLSVNGAHLIKFYQQPSPQIAELLSARSAGKINAGTNITGGGSYVRQNGKPDWKWTAALSWRLEQFSAGVFTQYISDVDDTGLIDSTGAPWIIASQITANVYGQYAFTKGWAANTRLKLGVRNLTNEAPPVSSNGYLASMYQPYGRYLYASIRKSF
ncbi:TonB-dependent siderophore receptor [uncultured Caulobacter sp.]|uniref:TonB-dependent receptor plug domain-containing protein n=1 Tax=uncultured Caulobacter sp. TaxID=158749 RepID=UPI002614605A|nr:TonB-dependent receptor [uncultured Caulobacter sp.]